MPNTNVKSKMLDLQSNMKRAGWIQLAEDAEADIAKAKLRIAQLTEASRIFRKNAETGMPWPEAQ